jgi:DNA invertase Pin-like site-specific DNA recombinase
MEEMEGVNHNTRKRRYGARDKEELIREIIYLHSCGFSQVDIAKKLKLNRGTLKRWNDELHFIKSRTPGESWKTQK